MTTRAFATLLFEVWRTPRNRRHVVRLCLVAYLDAASVQLKSNHELAARGTP